jgi:hypothetical protein
MVIIVPCKWVTRKTEATGSTQTREPRCKALHNPANLRVVL